MLFFEIGVPSHIEFTIKPKRIPKKTSNFNTAEYILFLYVKLRDLLFSFLDVEEKRIKLFFQKFLYNKICKKFSVMYFFFLLCTPRNLLKVCIGAKTCGCTWMKIADIEKKGNENPFSEVYAYSLCKSLSAAVLNLQRSNILAETHEKSDN